MVRFKKLKTLEIENIIDHRKIFDICELCIRNYRNLTTLNISCKGIDDIFLNYLGNFGGKLKNLTLG